MFLLLAPVAAFFSASAVFSVVRFLPTGISRLKPLVMRNVKHRAFFTIYDNDYTIEYVYNKFNMQEAAIDFCAMNGEKLGITLKTFPACVSYIVSVLQDNHSSKSSALVRVDGAVARLPSPSSSSTISSPFSSPTPSLVHFYEMNKQNWTQTLEQEKADVKKTEPLNNIQENLSSIKNNFQNYQNDQKNKNTLKNENDIDIQKIKEEKMELSKDEKVEEQTELNEFEYTLDLEINGVTYVFEFPQEKVMTHSQAAHQLASKFCASHSSELGLPSLPSDKSSDGLSDKAAEAVRLAVNRHCQQPLAKALLEDLVKKVNSHKANNASIEENKNNAVNNTLSSHSSSEKNVNNNENPKRAGAFMKSS